MKPSPNLFDYATSELSQDAIISWLLMWGNPNPKYKKDDAELHSCSKKIIRSFFKLHGKAQPQKIKTVEVDKQKSNIDVLCIVNDEWYIIIEDKTETLQHSNQLERYIKTIAENVDSSKILGIYFKTHEQSSLKEVTEAGYKPFLRENLLPILRGCNSKNNIFCDFRHHIEKLDERFKSYKTLRLECWDKYSWMGFYQYLKPKFDASWEYVANPSGGFWGFHWEWIQDTEYDYGAYLQLEQDTFCFKVGGVAKEHRRNARQKWHDKLVGDVGKDGLSIVKPKRFGNGLYMTVAVLNDDFRRSDKDGKLDLAATVSLIKKMHARLKSAAKRT